MIDSEGKITVFKFNRTSWKRYYNCEYFRKQLEMVLQYKIKNFEIFRWNQTIVWNKKNMKKAEPYY